MISLANLLGEFKKWLDGEEAAAMEHEPPRARREWEEFLISVAREIESVMQREMFTPPGGPTYIPPEYLVFLSREDDAQWQGSKREGLERGLNYVLAQRVQELLGNDDVQTRSFAVELRIDGALEKGKFRVQPVWDVLSPKTEVRPRRKESPAGVPSTPAEDEGANEATIVRPRAPLLSITIAQGDEKPETRHFHQKQVTIGRGSKDFPVDVKLEGDLEISRKQAIIEKREDRDCVLSCEGRNPIEVDGLELTQGQTIELRAGQVIRIGPYKICLPADEKVSPEMQSEKSESREKPDETPVVHPQS
ncbi:MAG: FHA domain-containing protein [Acidobacteriota bacterium]